MSDLTPEDILDDFARELKYLPKTHRHKFYVEIRDKAKAQLAKCSPSQKEDRPEREGEIDTILVKLLLRYEKAVKNSQQLDKQDIPKTINEISALFPDKEERK